MPKSIAERLADNASALRSTVDRVRADRLISDYGKQLALARAYSTAKRRHQDLLREDEQDRIRSVEAAARSLFGLGHAADAQTLIARRDASDRVEKLHTAADGLRMLEKAVNLGDQQLARAVLARAWELATPEGPGKAWGAVVEKYLGEYPDDVTAADRLVQAANGGLSRKDRLLANMGMSRPDELKSLPDVDTWLVSQGERLDAPSTEAPPAPTESSNTLFRDGFSVSRANHETGAYRAPAAAGTGGDAA